MRDKVLSGEQKMHLQQGDPAVYRPGLPDDRATALGQWMDRCARLAALACTRPAVILLTPLIVTVHSQAYRKADWQMGFHDFEVSSIISIILLYIIIILGVLLHEFGHLGAALRAGLKGGRLVVCLNRWPPVFRADLSGLTNLPRWRRAAVDLAGCWLQLIFTVPLGSVYWATGRGCWLLAIYLTDMAVLLAIIPTPRSDGYWFFSDIQGLQYMELEFWDVFDGNGPPSRSRLLARVSASIGFSLFLLYVLGVSWLAAWALKLGLTTVKQIIEGNRYDDSAFMACKLVLLLLLVANFAWFAAQRTGIVTRFASRLLMSMRCGSLPPGSGHF